MSVYLEKMLSAWSAEERAKINVNWDRIMATFSKLQLQINMFVGGDVAELVDQINEAITNANATGEDLLQLIVEVEGKLAEAATAIADTENATDAATAIKNELVVLKSALVTLQNELTVLKNEFSLAEDGRVAAEGIRVQNETSRTAAETGRVTAEGERLAAELVRFENEDERMAAENARVLAENDRVAAEDLRQQRLAELIAVLDQLDFKGEYNPSSSYLPFNVVRFGRASYVALKEVSGVQPVDDGVNWRMVAAGGIDGMGAVSAVNGIEPDENGNVQLVIDFINTLTSDRTDAGLSAAMGKALKGLIDGHVGAVDNPHQVTAEQLALGNVQNFGVASQEEAESGTVSDKYLTPQRGKQLFDKNLMPLQQTLNSHLAKITQRIFCIKLSNQTLGNQVDTLINFDNLEKNNPEANFAQLNDGKIEIIVDGEYEIKLGVCFTINVNGARRVSPHHIAFSNTVKSTDAPTYISSSYRARFTTGTILDLKAYQNSGGALDVIGSNTRCTISRIG